MEDFYDGNGTGDEYDPSQDVIAAEMRRTGRSFQPHQAPQGLGDDQSLVQQAVESYVLTPAFLQAQAQRLTQDPTVQAMLAEMLQQQAQQSVVRPYMPYVLLAATAAGVAGGIIGWYAMQWWRGS